MDVGRVAPGKDFYYFDDSREWVIFPLLVEGDRFLPLSLYGSYSVKFSDSVGGGNALMVFDVLVDLAARDLGFKNPQVFVVETEFIAYDFPLRDDARAALESGQHPEGVPAVVRREEKGFRTICAWILGSGRETFLTGDDLRRVADYVFSNEFWRRIGEQSGKPCVVDPDQYLAEKSANQEATWVPGVIYLGL